jgi:hypothetical protein
VGPRCVVVSVSMCMSRVMCIKVSDFVVVMVMFMRNGDDAEDPYTKGGVWQQWSIVPFRMAEFPKPPSST